MMATPRVFQLKGTCNNYPWGRQGRESLAARLCSRTPGTDFHIDDGEPYSEMWFGDYPDFPARVLKTGELLQDVLQQNKEALLGKKVIRELGGQLPYLPKILSIAKALPLQIHPNKELAARLHAEDPENFTDPNHKPEIAVALSRFESFGGWKPLSEIESLFALSHALGRFVPAGTSSWTDDTLRQVTKSMLLADEATVEAVEDALAKLPRADLERAKAGHIPDVLPRLRRQYGAQDPGSLVALACMNFLVLEPLDAIYIPADGIHAYLSGDIVECMARSNNVLNAGFCPRADRDSIDLFASALTFRAHGREDLLLPSGVSARSRSGKTRVYRPPMTEFDMLAASLGPGESDDLAPTEGPGVLIVTGGEGSMEVAGEGRFELKEGFIYFVAPGLEIRWETDRGVQVFMAAV